MTKVLKFTNESGLTLNPTKCEVYFINTPPEAKAETLDKLNHLLPGIRVLDDSSFDLLGSPITAEGIPASLTTTLDTVKTICKRLTSMDVHPALRLLRCSLSSPRFQHLLRSSPTFTHMHQLAEIDNFYRLTLETITNNELSERSWTQASLPLAFAGLGIRRLSDLAHPAYFASVFQSQLTSNLILSKFNLCVLDHSFTASIESYPPEWLPVSPELKMNQASWDFLRVKQIHNELLSSSGPTDRARLLASSSKTSSKWLQAIPSHQLGLFLDNDSARIAVGLRLGNKVCEAHTCVCGEVVESNGHHALSCKLAKAKYSTHLDMNKVFSMAFRSAGYPNK